MIERKRERERERDSIMNQGGQKQRKTQQRKENEKICSELNLVLKSIVKKSVRVGCKF